MLRTDFTASNHKTDYQINCTVESANSAPSKNNKEKKEKRKSGNTTHSNCLPDQQHKVRTEKMKRKAKIIWNKATMQKRALKTNTGKIPGQKTNTPR